MNRYLCLHGHFYQPPRENPWLEEVELQDSASPFHDWNQRITAECYGPNTGARIIDDEGRIARIVNNYARMSFNFGPTLLSWMERHKPVVYEAIIAADHESRDIFGGHGSAIAQVYNHMIMPLANERDRRTQVYWGVEDFRRRFGRDPVGMWLPETAVDLRTLDILLDYGIRFTVLAPRQAHRVAEPDGSEPTKGGKKKDAAKERHWIDVSGDRIDPTRPYKISLPSGREMALFFYDGHISQDLAFGDLLDSGVRFKERLLNVFSDERDWPQLVHVATDGETYGHHHKHGEMALAWMFEDILKDHEVALTNYSQFLEMHPPEAEVEIYENSSWSCVHGVERWRSDCGCNSGMHFGWNQKWRKPLREAMNWLRDKSADVFDKQGPKYLNDPWKARDEYVKVVLDRSFENVNAFLSEHAKSPLPPEQVVTTLKLLEMQRYAQLIFTSCAWFFDEVSGIETVQVMQYAARTLQLLGDLTGKNYEDEYLELLGKAPSNVYPSAKDSYLENVKPAQVDLLRAAAHFAISSFFEEYQESFDYACYSVIHEYYNRVPAGRLGLVTGKAQVTSTLTRESVTIAFAVLHAGDHNLNCGVRFYEGSEAFNKLEKGLRIPFERGDLTGAIRTMDEHFGKNLFSVWHLFKDEQRRVVDKVLEPAYQLAEAAYRQIYEGNQAMLNFLSWLHIPSPRHFFDATQFVVNNDLKQMFEHDEVDPEQVKALLEQCDRWNLPLDESVGHHASEWVNRRMDEFALTPDDVELLEHTVEVLERLGPIPMGARIWEAQNICYTEARELMANGRRLFEASTDDGTRWERAFTRLCELLKVKPK
ncbi:glycoside hydrolase [Oceanidesulfovibrio indonesiensis]|uniref:Glycoside hydrolase n=1 Tax=Oceanidesulfovibrio indonesiensis TaxID=54767 RepID=A0A7M3MFY7_9BACT|nr:DUF3536 domain-containing protein [Oceanidesulfovibrio indonesiensis]TVM17961.1 glycoside hydrolase [Oceanidesulfovibrio indonesiensis]